MSSVVLSGDTSGAITLAAPSIAGTNTLTLPAVTGTAAITTQMMNLRNRIINGAMMIDQRNAGASVTPNTSVDVFPVDRWTGQVTQNSKLTMQQNAGAVTPPAGYINYVGATSSSAYSVVSTDVFLLSKKIEGFNIADLGWGTANAKTVTLSFWVRSSLTGTFGGSLNNGANNRSYPFNYTISSANTWTQISVTIAGDTTGTWYTNNNLGVAVRFSLGSGATYTTTANAWAAGNYFSPTGCVSVVGTSGATFYITGVQLEAGTTATPFDYRQYGTELALCQRYYETGGGYAGSRSGDNLTIGSAYYRCTKRAAPTVVLSGSNSPTVVSGTIEYIGWFATGVSASYSNTMTYTSSAEL